MKNFFRKSLFSVKRHLFYLLPGSPIVPPLLSRPYLNRSEVPVLATGAMSWAPSFS